MATTPSTSISSSYQRLGGSTPVITQTGGPGGGGPRLATKKSLKDKALEEFEAEKAVAEAREKNMQETIKKDPFLSEVYGRMQAQRNAYVRSAQENREGLRKAMTAANPFGSAGPALSESARRQAGQRYALDQERAANRAAKEEAQYRANYNRQFR
jgi:hypothetical protein